MLATLGCWVCLLGFKMGQKVGGNIRPFDIAVNFHFFFMLMGIAIEKNLGFNQISNTLLIIWVPFLAAMVINFRYPSLTYRLTSRKFWILTFSDL